MKITHKLSLSASPEAFKAFSSLDIVLEKGFSSFKIMETDPRWPEIANLIERFNVVDISWTEFSAQEIEAADFLAVLTDSHHGYPEPSDDFGYLEASYDTSHYCETCGCGLIQAASFSTRKRARPLRKNFFQLNWLFDELFAAREIWETVLKEFCIDGKPLLNLRTGEALPDIVQLVIPQTGIGLDLAGLPKQTCENCRRVKYEPFTRGFFPALMEDTKLPLFRPAPYFGSGASASHAIIMSGELYGALRDATALEGLVVTPLATTA